MAEHIEKLHKFVCHWSRQHKSATSVSLLVPSFDTWGLRKKGNQYNKQAKYVPQGPFGALKPAWWLQRLSVWFHRIWSTSATCNKLLVTPCLLDSLILWTSSKMIAYICTAERKTTRLCQVTWNVGLTFCSLLSVSQKWLKRAINTNEKLRRLYDSYFLTTLEADHRSVESKYQIFQQWIRIYSKR